jgi:hypothetical protein
MSAFLKDTCKGMEKIMDTNLKKEREWADREPDEETPAYERTYRDGSLQNECWSEKGYTSREREYEKRTGEDD